MDVLSNVYERERMCLICTYCICTCGDVLDTIKDMTVGSLCEGPFIGLLTLHAYVILCSINKTFLSKQAEENLQIIFGILQMKLHVLVSTAAQWSKDRNGRI
jgi:hypothetical protein